MTPLSGIDISKKGKKQKWNQSISDSDTHMSRNLYDTNVDIEIIDQAGSECRVHISSEDVREKLIWTIDIHEQCGKKPEYSLPECIIKREPLCQAWEKKDRKLHPDIERRSSEAHISRPHIEPSHYDRRHRLISLIPPVSIRYDSQGVIPDPVWDKTEEDEYKEDENSTLPMDECLK